MSELVKCFYGNLDGKRQGMVIASSQKQAAEIAGVSLHYFKGWWSQGLFPENKDVTYKPYVLYSKPNHSSGVWVEGNGKEIKK